MEIYKDLNNPDNQQFEKLLNSQLSKINIEEGKIILTLKLKSEDKKNELPLDFTFKKVEDNWRIDRIAKVQT